MQFRATIFDLDGTLLDTLDDISNAANRVLAARGFPTHSNPNYRTFIGEGVVKLMLRALPEAHQRLWSLLCKGKLLPDSS